MKKRAEKIKIVVEGKRLRDKIRKHRMEMCITARRKLND